MFLFRHTALIFGLELLAVVAFFEQLAQRLGGQCVWVYVDNNNVLAAITRGDSNADVAAVLVAQLWNTLQRFSNCAWFSRFRSQINPADLPTRGRQLPFRARELGRLSALPLLFRHTREQLQRLRPLRRDRFRRGEAN